MKFSLGLEPSRGARHNTPPLIFFNKLGEEGWFGGCSDWKLKLLNAPEMFLYIIKIKLYG